MTGLKQLFAFGSGIGIQIAGPRGAESLHIAAARVRPNRATLLGRLTIENSPAQPAGVWGTEYAAFARKLDLRHVAATVLLPRQDVIVRHLALPGVADKDLPAAVGFQLDGLHPYAEDDVISSWSRLPGTSTVLVAIARRDAIDRYSALFAEAGVKIGCFTCSAAAIYSSLRLVNRGLPREILTAEPVDGHIEYYGESAARPLFSAAFDAQEARGAAFACAELRVDPQTEPRPLEELLHASPPQPFAAALASACPPLALSLNLLPADRRQTSSRAAWIPVSIGATAVVAAATALAVFPAIENHRYQNTLEAEIRKVQPLANRAAQLDREIEAARRRTAQLDEFRHRAKADLDVLAELTRILPPPIWLNLVDISRDQVIVQGEADQAANLLKVIDSSPLFESSEFQQPPFRNGAIDLFRIRTKREAGR